MFEAFGDDAYDWEDEYWDDICDNPNCTVCNPPRIYNLDDLVGEGDGLAD